VEFTQRIDIDSLTSAFLDEFASRLDETQLDAITSGGFRTVTDVTNLPDADTIDPVKEPQVALQALAARPFSEILPADEPFVLPLLPYLEAAGQQLPPDVRVQADRHAFYLVKYGLNAVPREKERFESLELRVDYPAGHLTHTLTPDTDLETRFAAKSSVTLGLDGSLRFEVPTVQVATGVGAGAGVKAEGHSELLYSWEHRVMRARIIATGAKSNYSQWIIEDPKDVVGSVEFAVVLRVPLHAESLSFTMSGQYAVATGIAWWKNSTVKRFSTRETVVVAVTS
jgi:hypothetical protein